MSLMGICIFIVCLGLALFIFNRLAPNAAVGYYGGIILAAILLVFLLNRFGGLQF